MKISRTISRHAVLALCAAAMACALMAPGASRATEQPVSVALALATEQPVSTSRATEQPVAAEQPIIVAQGDCYAIGQQIAAQNGGTLARASQANRGGQTVCVIVVLVPGKEGQRPRRQEFVVPAN